MDWPDRFSEGTGAIEASEIRELLKLLEDPEVLSFAGGIPDSALFPLKELREAQALIEADGVRGRAAMQYSASEGYPALRDWIAARHQTVDFDLAAENTVVTNGGQQSLMLLASALINPGDKLAVGNPTYLGALQAFGTRRPDYLTIETDDNGLCLESLERAFKEGAKILYTVPDFQNPGGFTLPTARREKLMELAHKHQVVIIEDVAYRALYYDGPPPPSLLELDGAMVEDWNRDGLVAQVGTFSKTLMPALRIGWTVAPSQLIDKLVLLKQANDLHTSTCNQATALELALGCLEKHKERLREVYKQRRDAMVSALTRHLPQAAHFSRPTGGMFVWVSLPTGIDTRALLKRAVADHKIAFVPGAAFHAKGGGDNTLRLSFSTCSAEEIEEGMKRLCQLITEQLRD